MSSKGISNIRFYLVEVGFITFCSYKSDSCLTYLFAKVVIINMAQTVFLFYFSVALSLCHYLYTKPSEIGWETFSQIQMRDIDSFFLFFFFFKYFLSSTLSQSQDINILLSGKTYFH